VEDKPNPIEAVSNMLQQTANMQYNSAKVIIRWEFLDHTFTVESLNPISAFTMMDKVKEAAKQKMIRDKQRGD
jgi:hypothetical protein